MHAIKADQNNQNVFISRGVSSRENYFVPMKENYIYDLRFSFPINFFSGVDAYKGYFEKEIKNFKGSLDNLKQK